MGNMAELLDMTCDLFFVEPIFLQVLAGSLNETFDTEYLRRSLFVGICFPSGFGCWN
jgi:hypothetical protein